MIRKLRIKFVCINMGIVTVMLLVIFGMVLHSTRENLEMQSIRMMHSAVSGEQPRPVRPGERQEEIPLPFFRAELDRTGALIETSGGFFDLSDEAQIRKILQAALEKKEDSGILRDYRLRYQRWDTPLGQTVGFVDMSGEIATITGLMRTCLLIGGISFLAFLGLSFVLARWAVRPVEVAWNQQRQFVADASHELKTPLTVILTNAELLRVPGRGPEEQKRLSESILTMSHQMRGLVESLLELARVDNGTAKLSFSELDLSTLVEEGLLPFEPVYFEKELQLESRVVPGLRVRGSESHLRQVLDILLDNAAKYCTPRGTVKVELKWQGSHCVMSVSNPGEEISREDLKNIFKRFYRIDKARTGNHSYGLGLSIAESIVQGHGGKIWAESKAGVNTFFVSLNGM